VQYEEITYEGYGPGGVALMISSLTDNRNRTAGEVRSLLTRYGGSLGSTNSVAFIFNQRGLAQVNKDLIDEDSLYSKTLELGAEDIVDQGDTWAIYCEPKDLENIRSALVSDGLEVEAEIRSIPANTVTVIGDTAQQLLKLLDALDDLDDVQNVVANFEMDDSLMDSLGV
jgi:YebC/PmpR family DNA-binding regulatory protein